MGLIWSFCRIFPTLVSDGEKLQNWKICYKNVTKSFPVEPSKSNFLKLISETNWTITCQNCHRWSPVTILEPHTFFKSNQIQQLEVSAWQCCSISSAQDTLWCRLKWSILSILSQASRWGGGRSSTNQQVEQGTAPTWWKPFRVRNPAVSTGWWWDWRPASLTMRRSADQGRRSHRFSASTAMVRIQYSLNCLLWRF